MKRSKSVLIVDDEVLVRIGIRHSLDWEKHGFVLAGEASDGEECMEWVARCRPDVILLDVRMPKMDGIQVLKKLKEKKYRGKVIILTCYEELAYARSAMKYGAADYVLKTTLNENGLLNALEELEFEEEDPISAGLPFGLATEEEVVMKALNGYPVSLKDISLRPNHLYGISVVIRRLPQVLKRYEGNEEDFFHSSFQSILRQAFNSQRECICIQYRPDMAVIFLSFSGLSSGQDSRLKVRGLAGHLARVLKEYMELEIVIGISSPKYQVSQLKTAFDEAVWALEKSFVCPDKEIFYFEPLDFGKWEKGLRLLERQMEEAVLDRDYEEAGEKSEGYFEMIRRSGGFKISERKRFLGGLMKLAQGLERDYDSVEEAQSWETLDEWETAVYGTFSRYLKKDEGGEGNYLIKKAKEYLEDHFTQGVTLSGLAKYMELSESYTSRLFNKGMGMNISAYVNNLRVEKAKSRLLHSNCKIYEIASEVGYSSTTAFHTAFKKCTGITPAEFRNENY